MKTTGVGRLFAAGALAAVCGLGVAADRMDDIGKREFEQNCIACHGSGARGDGYYMAMLNAPPSDLTQLAKGNGGVFPIARVYQVIDGRQAVKAHGAREMPLWGARYNEQAVTVYDDYPYQGEVFARGRILALIDYLYRLQAR